MGRLLLLIGFMSVLSWGASGQVRISGQVLAQETQQPVDAAHVLLYRSADSVLIAFGRTTKEGFTLMYAGKTDQTYYLKVSHINYREAKRTLTQEQLSGAPVRVEMTPGSHLLNEVKITAAVPVREVGDSTRYKVNAFMSGAEQTLEDVLRKMPNVRVEDNGDIYFKNKKIEKIYLDGDDLIGSTYQTATRSINPTVLNEVQAIENFTENRLLKQLANSNKTVLNLTVKDDRKALVFGMIDAGLGPQRHNVVGNLFSYSRRVKAFATVASNNVGLKRLDITSQTPTQFTNEIRDDEFLLKPVAQTVQPFTQYLNSPLENINNERMASVNGVVAPTKALKITTNLMLFADQIQLTRAQSYQILTDTPFSYQQIDGLRQRPVQGQFSMQVAYDWSPTTSILYKGSLKARDISLTQTTDFTGLGTRQLFPQQFVNQANDLRQLLEVTHKLNQRNALVASLRYTDARLGERLNGQLAPALAVSLLNDTLSQGTFRQRMEQRSRIGEGKLTWFYGNNGLKLEQQAGTSAMIANLNLQQATASVNADPYTLPIQKTVVYGRSAAKYSWDKLELSGNVQLDLVSAQIGPTSYRRQIVQASVSAAYRMSELSRLLLTYQKEATPVANSLLLNRYVVTDYRSAQQGIQGLLFDQREQLVVSYLFTDVIQRKMTVLASLFSNRFNNQWGLVDYQLMPTYSVFRLLDTPGVRADGVNLVLEKLIFPLAGNIRIDAKLLRSKIFQILNGKMQTTVSYLPIITARHTTVLNSPFNLEIGGTYRHTALTVFQNDLPVTQAFTVVNIYAHLLYRKPKLTLDLTTESNWIQGRSYSFLKANASYKLSRKIGLRLEAANLLNQRNFRQVTVTPVSYAEMVYPLLGRQGLLHVQYNF
ncbi:hypothetical protein [Spirosoma sp. KUDC1026]|uniref:hypothetical protein n=1 Tax=Spirosoma sp. KUDC1026 TaxID=2745947 RepID=UPI00159BA680|nr:hypothetical protein [Spirosoma sp. KUDC1026]QKZ11287.1 hypothetical protein HU175_01000 [Spirosoma sp. KUDC1026]